MSQLLYNESAWNPAQMKSQKMKLSNSKRQSIKLKIELPSYTSLEDEHDRLSCSQQICAKQVETDDEDDYQNATIRLEISFDTRQTPKRFKKNECLSARKVSLSSKKAPSLLTSGYSSSNSSMVNYVQEKSFYMEDEYNHINANENIYDKLDYKRRSLASTNSSISSTSSVSSSSSNRDNYEEISNFSQLKQYENKSVKSYKREYTINEIFQNLKEFKSEAKQLEMLNTTTITKTTTTTTPTCYTDIKPPKTVSFLKQIFESKSKKTPASSVSAKQSKDNTSKLQFVKTFKQKQEHVYVNEKISRPINV